MSRETMPEPRQGGSRETPQPKPEKGGGGKKAGKARATEAEDAAESEES